MHLKSFLKTTSTTPLGARLQNTGQPAFLKISKFVFAKNYFFICFGSF